jgi:Fe-S-cluster containining protein
MKEARFRIEEIPEESRSELCIACGKCCQVMILDGLPVDRRTSMDRSWLDWIALHGATPRVVREAGRRSLTLTVPTPCSKLVQKKGAYRCRIYRKRPYICRTYSCLEDGDIGDTAWKRAIRRKRALDRRAAVRRARSTRGRFPERDHPL